MRRVAGVGLLVAAGLAGCATKGSVRQVETQVLVLRTETARRDSARAAELARIIRLQQQAIDSLELTGQSIRRLDARLGNELLEVQRQLIAIQELTGQSQTRLSRLQAQLDARAIQSELLRAADTVRTPDSVAAVAPDSAPAPNPTADQMYQGALQQYRRGSVIVARRAFLGFLEAYPGHPLVPDAVYYVGETYEMAAPDSAEARFDELLRRFPESRRAPGALYKIGLMAERRGDRTKARTSYQQLMQRYPRSEEADLARGRLESLRP